MNIINILSVSFAITTMLAAAIFGVTYICYGCTSKNVSNIVNGSLRTVLAVCTCISLCSLKSEAFGAFIAGLFKRETTEFVTVTLDNTTNYGVAEIFLLSITLLALGTCIDMHSVKNNKR